MSPEHQAARSRHAAIQDLVSSRSRALVAQVTRLTGDRWLAEDAVQEALLRLWQRPDVMDESRNITAWLFRVAHNIAIDWARARQVRAAAIEKISGAQVVEPDHAENIASTLSVLQLLEGLKTRHREILCKAYLNDQSVREIADELRIPATTAKSRLQSALRQLRDDDDQSPDWSRRLQTRPSCGHDRVVRPSPQSRRV